MHGRWLWIAVAAVVLLGLAAVTHKYGRKALRRYKDSVGPIARYYGSPAARQGTNGLLFLHHSCGMNWLNQGLLDALRAKPYVEAFSDVDYKVSVAPDAGRPASLGEPAGDRTDMNHWILWFNDYLGSLRTFRRGGGEITNRIILFKSCYPMSQVTGEGSEPGDPFSPEKTLANYRAVFRHPDGPGRTYEREGVSYRPLEEVFAGNPDVLFVVITAPPLSNERNDDASAHRARVFVNWLKGEWLDDYNRRNPGLANVAVFDWFDILANPDDAAEFPNRLKRDYGGATSDSHPTAVANRRSTEIFASGPDAFLDRAWAAFEKARANP